MAHDLILGASPRNWARSESTQSAWKGNAQPIVSPISDGKGEHGKPAIPEEGIEGEIKDLESSLGKGGGEAASKVAAGTGKGISAFARAVGKGLGALARGAGSAVTSKKSSSSSHSSSRPSGTPFTHKLSNALSRHTHRSELKRYSKIEKKSAQGSPAHQKYVKHQVTLAQRGDKGALARTQAMKLTRMVRLASKTPTDRKYLSAGNKLAKGVLKKNPKAIQQHKHLQAAANQGNPHAKKILAGAGISAAVIATVATGRVTLPKSKQKIVLTKQADEARHKALAGKITKEEAEAGAKAAKQLGDKRTEAYLSQIAEKAPPSKPTAKPQAEPLAKPPIQREQAQADEASTEESSPESRGPDHDEGPVASPKEIQALYAKLWTEHARQLAQQDQEAHLPSKSLENYQTLSKLWAKEELAKQGIPTDSLAGDLDEELESLLR
jgi:hypothetical protein